MPPKKADEVERPEPEPPLNPALTAAMTASTAGLLAVVSAPSRAIDLIPLDDYELFRFLHVRLWFADTAKARAWWFGGSLYNYLVGDNPDWVSLSGMHTKQVLQVLGREELSGLKPLESYKVSTETARRAYAALDKASNGDFKRMLRER